MVGMRNVSFSQDLGGGEGRGEGGASSGGAWKGGNSEVGDQRR